MIELFLFCYNEEIRIGTTLQHYKKMFPEIRITLCNNESTDKSVEIAKSMGCEIYTYKTNNILNEFVHHDIRNNFWKKSTKRWIIICDMDELLCMTQKDLEREDAMGVSLIKTQGYNMCANSLSNTLDDIKIEQIDSGFEDNHYSKLICFKRTDVHEMRFGPGGHVSFPMGRNIKYSEKIYPLYHYKFLGYQYLLENYSLNYSRSHQMRHFGMSLHYKNLPNQIKDLMENVRAKSTKLSSLEAMQKR